MILAEPEIAGNTGAIGRTCVALGAKLWLVRPLGFQMTDRHIKRAGLDYWPHLDWTVVDSLTEVADALGRDRLWSFSTKADRVYTSAEFAPGDGLVFGPESRGLPESWLVERPDRAVRIPIRPEARSLNLSTAVAIGLAEATRRSGGGTDLTPTGMRRRGNMARRPGASSGITGSQPPSARPGPLSPAPPRELPHAIAPDHRRLGLDRLRLRPLLDPAVVRARGRRENPARSRSRSLTRWSTSRCSSASAFLWMAAGPIRARWVMVAGVVAAVVSELGQNVPIVNRDANFPDGLADVAGVVSGIVAFVLLQGRYARLRPPTSGPIDRLG